MKKFFVLLNAFLLIVASCAISGDEETGGFGVGGKEIFARIITDESTQFKMLFQLSGDMDERKEETGTFAELKQKTFSFDQIPAGTKINVVCTIIYDDGSGEGQEIFRAVGNDIIIKEGHNDIRLKMEKTLGGPVFVIDLPDFQNEIEVVLDKTGKTLFATQGYSTYKWIVNGADQTSTTSELDISSLASGVYQIAVIADGIYSARYELVWTN